MSIPAPVYVLAGALVAAAIEYLRDKRKGRVDDRTVAIEERKASGTIDTSPAEELWAEGERIRHWLRDEVDRQRGELASMRTDLATEKDQNRVALNEMREAHRLVVAEMQAKHQRCTDRIGHMEEVVRELNARLKDQEDKK
jgi:hypothetical protein